MPGSIRAKCREKRELLREASRGIESLLENNRSAPERLADVDVNRLNRLRQILNRVERSLGEARTRYIGAPTERKQLLRRELQNRIASARMLLSLAREVALTCCRENQYLLANILD